jgi:hypothetical protein
MKLSIRRAIGKPDVRFLNAQAMRSAFERKNALQLGISGR